MIFENLFYQSFVDFKKELILCHSRIGVEGATQQLIQQLEDAIIDFDNLNERDRILKDYVITTQTGGKITVINGVNDFFSYSRAMDSIMDFYCKFANSSRFSEGGSAQKTSQEAKTNRAAQVEAINTKIMLREEKYSEFVAKLLAAYGKLNYEDTTLPFTFKVNGNILREETTFLDNILKQVNLGTMSLVEAISQLRKIPYSQAETIFNKIKEFNSENEFSISMDSMDMDNGFGEGEDDKGEGATPQGGRPLDVAG